MYYPPKNLTQRHSAVFYVAPLTTHERVLAPNNLIILLKVLDKLFVLRRLLLESVTHLALYLRRANSKVAHVHQTVDSLTGLKFENCH